MSMQVTIVRGGWRGEKAQKPGGGWDKWWNEESEGWKWWGWSSGPVNPEEVQRVHVLQRNAGGGGKP